MRGGNNGQNAESDLFRKEPTVELGLEGKVALVTGGSKGVGRGVSDALVAEGCHVSICSRNGEEVRRAAGELEEIGAAGVRVVADDVVEGEGAPRPGQTRNKTGHSGNLGMRVAERES